MWETIETLYHGTIEAMSNKKGKKLVKHNQECKKKKKKEKKKKKDICIFLIGMKHAYLLTKYYNFLTRKFIQNIFIRQ